MDFLAYIVVAVAAYLLGSIPTGYLVARAKGIDIRTVGSGNIGATNVFRILGKPAGCLVLVADGLKGFFACRFVPAVVLEIFRGSSAGIDPANLEITSGVSAILGHNYTCWLKFKGGKGIATSAGVLGALVPWPLLAISLIWGAVFISTKYVSLASIAAAFALPFAAWFWRSRPIMILISAGLGALAIYKHRGNIRRLLDGTENRVSTKNKSETPES